MIITETSVLVFFIFLIFKGDLEKNNMKEIRLFSPLNFKSLNFFNQFESFFCDVVPVQPNTVYDEWEES